MCVTETNANAMKQLRDCHDWDLFMWDETVYVAAECNGASGAFSGAVLTTNAPKNYHCLYRISQAV